MLKPNSILKREEGNSNMTLQNAIEQYLFSRSKKLSERTIKTYQRNLKKFAAYAGESTLVESITDFMIDAFQVSLKSKLKEKTQSNYANTLRGFFKYWKAKGKCNIAWELIEGPRVPEHLPDHITEHQFRMIDSYLSDHTFDKLTRKLIFHLLWNTGMRVGELINLNLEDVDFHRNYATIITEKSKKARMIKWNDACHQLLKRYLPARILYNQQPALFQTPRSIKGRKTRLTTRTVQRWCKELSKELDFPITPHAFRHGKMHYVLSKGGRRHDIKEIAGHSSIQSSEIYTRLNVTEQSKVLDQYLPEYDQEANKNYSIVSKYTFNT